MAKRIGILTGGGDVPGLNSVIKGVTYRATDLKYEVLGFRRGWEGLTHLNLGDPESREKYLRPLTRDITRSIDRTGGTWLHSSRTNPKKMKKLPPHLKDTGYSTNENGTFDVSPSIQESLKTLDVDYLVAIGGDDTLSYAAHLQRLGVNVVCIPKTMDNDVRNTEYCIGFSTAITRAMDAVNRQRSTIGSHERVGIFRVFGRDAGYTALYTAYVCSSRCGIPEFPFNLKQMIELLAEDKRKNPSNYCIVILSEGARWDGYVVQEYGEPDAYGHRKKMSVAESFANEVSKMINEETAVSDLTYDLRSGEADFTDKLIASTFAGMAVDTIREGKAGLMTAIVNGCYTMSEIPDPKLGPRKVDSSMYNTVRYRPTYDNKIGLPLFLTKP
jgi:ATP-dependent phosphofructokinase / diphosphate-dependent phosphofructokinase